MDLKGIWEKVYRYLLKYKFVVLVVGIGIVLMTLPSTRRDDTHDIMLDAPVIAEMTIEEQLCEILSKINGAGDVDVMLTKISGEETIYQVDQKSKTQDTDSDISVSTVIIKDASKNEIGLIRQVNPPRYLGAIIVCQGADDPQVQLAITDAVSKVTGLGTHHISVLKMK